MQVKKKVISSFQTIQIFNLQYCDGRDRCDRRDNNKM